RLSESRLVVSVPLVNDTRESVSRGVVARAVSGTARMVSVAGSRAGPCACSGCVGDVSKIRVRMRAHSPLDGRVFSICTAVDARSRAEELGSGHVSALSCAAVVGLGTAVAVTLGDADGGFATCGGGPPRMS